MTVTHRRATTVFNRSNYTILDVTDLSTPTPTNFTADDLFGFYDVIMNVNLTETNWQTSSAFGILRGLANFLHRNQDNELDSGGGSRQLRLQAYLSTPFAVFNNAWLGLPDDADSVMGKSVALAVPGYRVFPSLLRTKCSWLLHPSHYICLWLVDCFHYFGASWRYHWPWLQRHLKYLSIQRSISLQRSQCPRGMTYIRGLRYFENLSQMCLQN